MVIVRLRCRRRFDLVVSRPALSGGRHPFSVRASGPDVRAVGSDAKRNQPTSINLEAPVGWVKRRFAAPTHRSRDASPGGSARRVPLDPPYASEASRCVNSSRTLRSPRVDWSVSVDGVRGAAPAESVATWRKRPTRRPRRRPSSGRRRALLQLAQQVARIGRPVRPRLRQAAQQQRLQRRADRPAAGGATAARGSSRTCFMQISITVAPVNTGVPVSRK